MKFKILLMAMLFLSPSFLKAQSGYLDTTFNLAGPVKGKKNIGGGMAGTRAMAIDKQGRIVAVACSSYNSTYAYVTRVRSNGVIDKPFGHTSLDSSITINFSTYGKNVGKITSVVFQDDGKILLGGSIATYTALSELFLVVRLNANGSLDSSFNGNGVVTLDVSAGNDLIDELALQSTGKIVAVGTAGSRIAAVRFNANGSIDTGFNSSTSVFLSNGVTTENGTGVALRQDTIVIAGDFSNAGYQNFTVMKLSPDGSFIWRKDIPAPISSFENNPTLAIQPNGKIIIGGSSSFKVVRLLSNGQLDNSFTNSIFYDGTLTGILLSRDGGIILTGHTYCSPNSCYSLVKLNSIGDLDSSFGNNGKLKVSAGPGTITYKGAISSDNKVLLPTEESSTAMLVKIQLKSPIHILGSSYVLPNSSETFKVEFPSDWIVNNISWSNLSQNVFSLNTTDPKALTLFFSDSATNVILSCSITMGTATMVERKLIFINRKATDAYQLEELQCPKKLTDCSVGYMDYFKLNLIRNDSSGCSSSGYSDFTKSNMVDTLAVGGVYSAALKVNIPNTYVGIWIDYNNDGHFNTSDEFVAEKFSGSATYIEIPNIILKNEAGYFGPKRMRVRCQPDTALGAGDACQKPGEKGETEDYMVVLVLQDELAAPQIITPNDDGKNDYFVIRGVKPDLKNRLMVFDRWGQEKFSAENYENNWNGTSKGEKLIPGTYYYLFTNDGKSIRGFLEIRY